MRTCLYCLEPLSSNADPRKRYCSKKCSDARRADAKKLEPQLKLCDGCKSEFITSRPKQRFCSQVCAYDFHLAQANKRYADFREANPLPEVYHFTCDLCSLKFSKPYQVKGIAVQRGVYCEDCRPIAQSMRYRLKTVKRQSQTTPANRIAHEQLAERDGLNCYLCNEVIDMALPRTSKMGATIDHVVPLSRGGLDELDNLKLAHWTCNLAKSNKLVEELNG